MPNNISDLDDKALYLRVTWGKMINYASTFNRAFMDAEDEFKSGKYGPDWDFERWLIAKCGMSYRTTYRIVSILNRTASDAERERMKAAIKGKPGRKKKVRTPMPSAPPTPAQEAPEAPQAPMQATQATVTQLRPQAQALADSNVVPLPTPLDRLAGRMKAGWARKGAGRQEMTEGTIEFCASIAEARDQFVFDVEFGQWCDANGFGKTVIDPHSRAAAIHMGRNLIALRKCLETTNLMSLRYIYEREFNKFI